MPQVIGRQFEHHGFINGLHRGPFTRLKARAQTLMTGYQLSK
jgi:hypothetical protein